MSSSLMYTLTKLRSLPWSLYRCAFRPACRRVRSASNSPTVAPAASTLSCLSVYGRSGVGMRIFAMMQTALFESRTIVFQIPHGHVGSRAAHDRDNDIRERRPRMIQVVLRRPRRMIRVRMIKSQQLAPTLRRAPFRLAIVGRPHQKAPPRPFFSCIRQGKDRLHAAIPADERAAAFVRKRFFTVAADRSIRIRGD